MSFLQHLFPPILMRQGKAPKRKAVHRDWVRRVIPQETIHALRAEYEAIPLVNVYRKRGAVKALAVKYGLKPRYVHTILYLGIRDQEREPKP